MHIQLLLLTICFTSTVKAANILLFPGMMAASVCNEMRGFGEELINRGHDVAFYLPNNFDYSFMSDTNIEILTFQFKDSHKQLIGDIFKNMTETVFGKRQMNFIARNRARTTVMNTICDSVFADKDGLKKLKEQKFDLVLVEALPYTKCLFFLPRYLNVSYVGVASTIDGRDAGLPFQGNTFPHFMSSFPDNMSFFQRLKNVLVHVIQYVLRPYIIATTDPATYDSSLVGTDAEKLMQNALLYLENSDYVVDYHKAVIPNFVQVGGLTAKPANKLPLDLETFMSGATNGVIVVSFGSILSQAPEEIMEKLMTAFLNLKQRVIFKTDVNLLKRNVKLVKWFPQNDILGHSKVKLFFSHCGKNGFFESVYHGVPILCTPLNGDAFSTAIKVVHKQIGLSLDLKTVSANDILKAINIIFTNASFEINMRRTSQLLRDRPETSSARAASAIEHVIKYGGEHMQSSSRHLSLMSYVYADLWLIIFSVGIGLLYLLLKCVKCICCRKRAVTVKNTKSD